MTARRDDPSFDALVHAAREAATTAYAKYSRYSVGAAILTASGDIVRGCNVENASYGLSLCAERNAIFSARTRGLVDPKSAPVRAIAIHAPKGSMPLPCGACRQVLWEFGDESVPVIIDGVEGRVTKTLGELLPDAFRWGDA